MLNLLMTCFSFFFIIIFLEFIFYIIFLKFFIILYFFMENLRGKIKGGKKGRLCGLI